MSKDIATQIHEKAKPFVQWLQEAEEEEDSSDESDFEVEYNDRAKVEPLKKEIVQKTTTVPKQHDDEENDDLNIDEI